MKVFGGEGYDFEWLVRVCSDECFLSVRNLAWVLHLAMNHEALFL